MFGIPKLPTSCFKSSWTNLVPLRLAVLLVALMAFANTADAHPVPVAEAQLETTGDRFLLIITCDVPALVMSTPQGHLDGDLAEEFQSLSDRELQERIEDARRSLEERIEIVFDGTRVTSLEVGMPTPAAVRAVPIRHESKSELPIQVTASLPKDSQAVQVRFPEELGKVYLRLIRQDQTVARVLLKPGDRCQPLRFRDSKSNAATATNVAVAGKTDRPFRTVAPPMQSDEIVINQFLPVGYAHALFALSLCLLSPCRRPVIWQTLAYSVAHSLTLTLGTLGWHPLSAQILAPLMALSITVVAVANLVSNRLTSWRLAIMFGSGLVHGLAIAIVWQEHAVSERLPAASAFPSQAAFIGFIAGTELLQACLIAFVFALIRPFRDRSWFRPRLVIPASLLLALIGLWNACNPLFSA